MFCTVLFFSYCNRICFLFVRYDFYIFIFLVERVSFLVGGGDMVFAGSLAVLFRTGDLGFIIFAFFSSSSIFEGLAVEEFVF